MLRNSFCRDLAVLRMPHGGPFSPASIFLTNFPVANTAGHGIAYTGDYQEADGHWLLSPHFVTTLEFDHFVNAAWLAQIGARNGNIAGFWLEFGI